MLCSHLRFAICIFKQTCQKKGEHMNKIEEFKDLVFDYNHEILIINGEKVTEPIIVKLNSQDAWGVSKVFNYQMTRSGMELPVVTIDLDV